jgi:CcmD family protein
LSYLLGAYAFGLVVIGGYVWYLVRQSREVRARLQELEPATR